MANGIYEVRKQVASLLTRRNSGYRRHPPWCPSDCGSESGSNLVDRPHIGPAVSEFELGVVGIFLVLLRR